MIRIIYIDGSTTDKIQQDPPSIDQLREWIGSEYHELVTVYYDGKYEQMMVDDMGALNNSNVNEAATYIYHENARVHMPTLLSDTPCIYGIAVLLTGPHKFS